MTWTLYEGAFPLRNVGMRWKRIGTCAIGILTVTLKSVLMDQWGNRCPSTITSVFTPFLDWEDGWAFLHELHPDLPPCHEARLCHNILNHPEDWSREDLLKILACQDRRLDVVAYAGSCMGILHPSDIPANKLTSYTAKRLCEYQPDVYVKYFLPYHKDVHNLLHRMSTSALIECAGVEGCESEALYAEINKRGLVELFELD